MSEQEQPSMSQEEANVIARFLTDEEHRKYVCESIGRVTVSFSNRAIETLLEYSPQGKITRCNTRKTVNASVLSQEAKDSIEAARLATQIIEARERLRELEKDLDTLREKAGMDVKSAVMQLLNNATKPATQEHPNNDVPRGGFF